MNVVKFIESDPLAGVSQAIQDAVKQPPAFYQANPNQDGDGIDNIIDDVKEVMHEHPNVTHAVEGAAALAGLGAAGAVAPELLPSTLKSYMGGVM